MIRPRPCRRRTLGRPLALAAWAGVACRSPAEPGPPGAEAFAPPAVYARWWALTEACAGRRGDFRAVRWAGVPGAAFSTGRDAANGAWYAGQHLIVVADSAREDGHTVRHEMLHALLGDGPPQGGPLHPRAVFVGACAGFVWCQGRCTTDDRSYGAPAGAEVLPPESLEVAGHAVLQPPEADGQRWLALRVTVRNPANRPVIVAAPGDPTTPPTWGFEIRTPDRRGFGGGEVAADSSFLTFAPGEVKEWLREFRVVPGASALGDAPDRVPPGRLLVRGGYARRWAPYDTVQAGPQGSS